MRRLLIATIFIVPVLVGCHHFFGAKTGAELAAATDAGSDAPFKSREGFDAQLLGRFEPEPATDLTSANSATEKKASGKNFVAVTANPHATKAAAKMLAAGATAIDAAIAAQSVLGLVEPQSSGLGGGGFLVYWDANSKALHTYDGRETAPSIADENLFFNVEEEKPMSFFNAVLGGRSVGVPGLMRMLELAHNDFGRVPWPQLFSDAILLSEQGFLVSPRLELLLDKVPAVNARPTIASYFFPHKSALKAGDRLTNDAYAQTLRGLAAGGADYIYVDLAEKIAATVQADSNAGGLLASDLNDYQAIEREPLCVVLAEFRLCGISAPSSGPATVFSVLKILYERTANENLEALTSIAASPLLSHYFVEAQRLAFADRNAYIADPDFVAVPMQALMDDEYLEKRASLISADAVMNSVKPGDIRIDDVARVAVPSSERASTTHLSIKDGYGNVLSMTTSIETAFGSRLMVEGFILNNQLTDFSFAPYDADEGLVANRVEAGKRPVSSMAPIMVFDVDGEPIMAIGSPGGKSIIAYVARVLFETLILGRDLQESIDDQHLVHTGRGLVLESGLDSDVVEKLKSLGHQPQMRRQSSGVHAVHKSMHDKDLHWTGVADRRREGVVIAD